MDSYLENLAERSRSAWGDLLVAVGLDSGGRPHPVGAPPWLWDLTATQRQNLSHACGIEPSALQRLTMPSLTPGARAALSASPQLLSPPRSRFCPHCLAQNGGRWQLWWRLRWAFACPVHQCLLADTCQRCRRWQRTRSLPLGLIPAPGRCARAAENARGRDPRRCGAPLSEVPTLTLRPGHRVLSAQTTVLQMLSRGILADGIYGAKPVAVQQGLADLAALSARILNYAQDCDLEKLIAGDLLGAYRRTEAAELPRDHRARTSAASAVATALASVLALDVLGCPDSATAGVRLRWLVSTSRRRGVSVRASNIGWGRHTSEALLGVQLSALTPLLPPSDQLRYRCAALLPRRPDAVSRRWAQLPGALWPNIRSFYAVPGIGDEQLACGLSVAVGLVGSRCTLSQAVSALGAVTSARSVSRVLQTLQRDDRWPEMLAALTALAELLDTAPGHIDYGRRRGLPFAEFLPDQQWRQICMNTLTPPGRTVRARLARCWMFERVIGSPPRHCPSAIEDAQFRSKLTALRSWVTDRLVHELEQCARGFLDAHGCAGEPLTWQPGDELFEGAGLIRVEPPVPCDKRGISDALLPRLGEGGGRVSAPESLPDKAVRASALALLHAQLPLETFIRLYHEQQLGLADIGAQYGVSRQTVGRLAALYGVELRAPGRPYRVR